MISKRSPEVLIYPCCSLSVKQGINDTLCAKAIDLELCQVWNELAKEDKGGRAKKKVS